MRKLYCSFCGKAQHEVEQLIAGPKVFVCNECVAMLHAMVDKKHKPPDPTPKLNVKIGDTFRCNDKRWRVTDIGTRKVIAIPVKEDSMEGPPYAQGEIIFDEDDLAVCEIDHEEDTA